MSTGVTKTILVSDKVIVGESRIDNRRVANGASSHDSHKLNVDTTRVASNYIIKRDVSENKEQAKNYISSTKNSNVPVFSGIKFEV